jgi:hypothetical protein
MTTSSQQIEVRMASGVDMTTTGSKATYGAGLIPFIVRAVGVLYRTEPTGALVLDVRSRPTAGSATGETVAATLTGAASDDAGDVLYKENLNIKVVPGGEINLQVTTASAGATNVDVYALIEYSWERPANNTDMNASST